jgi:phage tail sheath protein FI
MPEYLSPGVFIEEIPARLKAIEGVSTSTAGFVGEAERGPVPGSFPQRAGSQMGTVNGLVFTRDDAPLLVTSFAEYQRTFGAPAVDPVVDGYLGHAVRAFFDNGGRRAYIARARRDDAETAFHQVDQRAILRLTRAVRASPTAPSLLFVNSLAGIDLAATFDVVLADGSTFAGMGSIAVASFDLQASRITVAPGGITADLDPDRVAIRPVVAGAPDPGPRFWARSPGAWGDDLRVRIAGSTRPPVRLMADVTAGSFTLQVQSTGAFYVGACIKIADGAGGSTENTVAEIRPGNVLRVVDALPGITLPTTDPALVQVQEIDIELRDAGTGATEVFRSLSWNSDPDPVVRQRHYSTVINNRSRLAFAEPTWAFLAATPASLSDEMPPTSLNQPMSRFGFEAGPDPSTEGGFDGTPSTSRAHIVGVDGGPGLRTGIQSLQDIDDVRIVAAPGEVDPTVQNELVTQAERMRYRFAVLDGEGISIGVNAILAHRNAYDSSYAAYYVPWVQVGVGDQKLFLPPSGHVAGIYARTDNDRGVWKAPANEVVRGLTGLLSYITTGEQDILNPRGVNAIRKFEGRGIRVWGARTLSSNPELRYINVRRFLIYMEASIDRGTQWVVFEPNAPPTWSRVTDSVSAFLHTQWRSGALFGRRPEDAFFVRCDETTMTVDDVQNGRLICEIGVAIVRPAEFVIFRIEQITGFGKAS